MPFRLLVILHKLFSYEMFPPALLISEINLSHYSLAKQLH